MGSYQVDDLLESKDENSFSKLLVCSFIRYCSLLLRRSKLKGQTHYFSSRRLMLLKNTETFISVVFSKQGPIRVNGKRIMKDELLLMTFTRRHKSLSMGERGRDTLNYFWELNFKCLK